MAKRYLPKPVPVTEDFKVLVSFLQQEFQIISDVIIEIQDKNFDVANVQPLKKAEGMIRFFDGTNFNPGAGRGLYIFTNNVWQKL